MNVDVFVSNTPESRQNLSVLHNFFMQVSEVRL